jgi:hypothetical protein
VRNLVASRSVLGFAPSQSRQPAPSSRSLRRRAPSIHTRIAHKHGSTRTRCRRSVATKCHAISPVRIAAESVRQRGQIVSTVPRRPTPRPKSGLAPCVGESHDQRVLRTGCASTAVFERPAGVWTPPATTSAHTPRCTRHRSSRRTGGQPHGPAGRKPGPAFWRCGLCRCLEAFSLTQAAGWLSRVM